MNKRTKVYTYNVLVSRLSRFGRNASGVLSALRFMQDYGVNLISVEDGADSSRDAGKHGRKLSDLQVRLNKMDDNIEDAGLNNDIHAEVVTLTASCPG